MTRPRNSTYRRLLALLASVIVFAAVWWAKTALNKSALVKAGWNPEVDAHPDAYFSRLAPEGSSVLSVGRSVPRPAQIDRFIVPQSGRDSVLLERYRYKRGVGRADVHFYYRRGGSLVDLYAAEHPSISGARTVDSVAADTWVHFPR